MLSNVIQGLVLVGLCAALYIPFMTAVPFWGQTTQNSSSLRPKRDRGPQRDVPNPNPKFGVIIYLGARP